MTTGARALLATLVNAGVTTCFTNPGTSEMHVVAALDETPQMHAILTLFEGVATGAADGYARMTGRPAATLLHLGPGLGNGLANLHNARRAAVPMINIIGDHATYHVPFDAQLQSDIETVARNISPTWVRTAMSTADLPGDVADALDAASAGEIATLIVPADLAWQEGAKPADPRPARIPRAASGAVINSVAQTIKAGRKVALLLGGAALYGPGLQLAGQLAAGTGATLFAPVFPTRIERGAGLPKVERLAYLAEMSHTQLRGFGQLILVDAPRPVAFFAYPGKRSDLVPDGCQVHELIGAGDDTVATLRALVDELGVGHWPIDVQEPDRPTIPKGALTGESACQTVAALLPERAIVVDESLTSGTMWNSASAGCPPHDVLTLTGGAIGFGLPNAVGAAVACPDRPVIALQADGSAMYTIQSLWTMARERLDVTVIIFNNASYGILDVELQRVGALGSGKAAHEQLDIGRPPLDFVALAAGMGVPGSRARTVRELAVQVSAALAEPGPHLIEAVVPPAFSGRKLTALPKALAVMESLPAPLAKALKRKLVP